MVNTHTQRPRLTISQAVEQYEVSRSTVKRGLNSGRYPGAEHDANGVWRIPIEALHAAEHKPRQNTGESAPPQSTGQGQSSMNQGHDLERRVTELEHALALEQAERRAAERIAEVEGRRAELAERALLMLDAGPGRSPVEGQAAAPSPAAPISTPSAAPEIEQPVEPFGRRLRRVFRPRG